MRTLIEALLDPEGGGRMDYDELISLRANSPAWRLLHSEGVAGSGEEAPGATERAANGAAHDSAE